jgi:Zn-dependent metalloprotease
MRIHPGSGFCLLPPHILRNIAQNGTPQQRQKALQTLSTDTTMRAARAAVGIAGARAVTPLVARQPGTKRRTIFNAKNGQQLPGELVRSETGKKTGDVAVDQAFDGLGQTYDFFWEVFERDSIDDEGLALNASVHFGQGYDNAFWDGTQMVFGDGDGELFNLFTVSVDVIGHELAHGVTEDEAGLIYLNEAGALNESISDVMGSMVKQKALKQTAAEADWLIGAGLLTSKVKGKALRSMSEPGTAFDDPVLGKDPQPGHMDHYVHTTEDHGGVHINSGIPNRAFYLAAKALGGRSWEKAGRVWYYTLRDSRIRRTSGFRAFALRTITNAGILFGESSSEKKGIAAAWAEVGVKV